MPLRVASALVLTFACALSAAAQSTTTRSAATSNNTSACTAAGSPSHCQAGFAGMQDPTRGTFNPAPANVSNQDIHSLLYSGNSTRVFAHVMPWWCMAPGSTQTGAGTVCQSHLQIGYNSNSSATVKAQVDDMARRGLDGLAISYYGRLNFYDETTLKFRDDLEGRCVGSWCPMQMALVEEQGSFIWTKCPADGKGSDRTQCIADAINADLDYMDANYFNTRSYLKVDPTTKQPSESGRPVILFFICEECFVNPVPNWSQIWAQVRGHAQQLARGNGLFIFRNAPGFAHDETDGAFAWVNWYGSDPYGLAYLNDFYAQSVLAEYQRLLTWGAAWKGFDDILASWAPSPSRYMGQRCGQTWLATMKAAESRYNINRQLPFFSIVTWNDYEEGTAIESGIDNCLSLSASVSGSILSWQLNFSSADGSESTVDQYVVYDSSDGENLTLKATLLPGTRSVDLKTLSLANGTHKLYVQAVGKPSIFNKLSGQVSYTLGPGASVSPTSLNFGTYIVGNTSSARAVTLTNSGNADLGVQKVVTSGDYSQTHNCPATLVAGAKCTIQVTFRPTTRNTRTGTLSITTSASTTPRTVSLTGVGTYAKLSLTSMTFAGRTVGTTSPAQTVMLTNVASSSVMKISGISTTGDFSQSNTCGPQLSPKASCSISVKFRPTAKGTRTGTVNINHDAGGSPSKVALTGTGL